MDSWRKAYGALKDSTKVGLAKVNSEFKDLDIAVVKATNHSECPPKERYVRSKRIFYPKIIIAYLPCPMPSQSLAAAVGIQQMEPVNILLRTSSMGYALVSANSNSYILFGKIFGATSVARPRADVAYCIHALSRRLAKTHNWITGERTPTRNFSDGKVTEWGQEQILVLTPKVALKVLIVVHRTLREGDPTFREELLNYAHRGNILRMSNFKDDSSPLAWDCSAWVRTYALFLEERLECFRILHYDIEAERMTKNAQGAKGHCRTRGLGSEELLQQLPALQQLLYRLIGCQPEGGSFYNYLIQYALALFFDMSRHDAIKALNLYKRAGQQAESLADFYEFCKGLELARNFQFPTLRQPPPSFLATMEEYIREAPRANGRLVYIIMFLPRFKMEDQESNLSACKPEVEAPAPEPAEEVEEIPAIEEEEPQPIPEAEAEPMPTQDTGDLLGLNEINPDARRLEESNALALAIVPHEVHNAAAAADDDANIWVWLTGYHTQQ
ncbi:hypothetical protein ACLOJK_030810 [Asimina triloba]